MALALLIIRTFRWGKNCSLHFTDKENWGPEKVSNFLKYSHHFVKAKFLFSWVLRFIRIGGVKWIEALMDSLKLGWGKVLSVKLSTGIEEAKTPQPVHPHSPTCWHLRWLQLRRADGKAWKRQLVTSIKIYFQSWSAFGWHQKYYPLAILTIKQGPISQQSLQKLHTLLA